MPIETLLPDAATTANPAWSGAIHTLLSEQGSGTTNCAGTNTGEAFTVSFGNLTSDVHSINSVRWYVAGQVGLIRGFSAVCQFDLQNASDSSYGYAETKTFDDTTFSTLQAGTERTTSDGSTAWTESLVNGLRINVRFDSIQNTSCNITLDFLKIDVNYTGAPLATYNSRRNNVHIASGNISISSGNIFI